MLRALKSFGAFWYDFVIGDDWQVAASMVVALAVTARVLAIYRSAPSTRPAGQGGPGTLDALTSREREVLALIGRGKTNGEIAAELFVSEGTVKTHINHVFTKLQLRDRAAAVVFAFDHDLVARD